MLTPEFFDACLPFATGYVVATKLKLVEPSGPLTLALGPPSEELIQTKLQNDGVRFHICAVDQIEPRAQREIDLGGSAPQGPLPSTQGGQALRVSAREHCTYEGFHLHQGGNGTVQRVMQHLLHAYISQAPGAFMAVNSCRGSHC